MSEKIIDGGPAFPWGEHGSRLGGMSLRDWFAGQALQASIITTIMAEKKPVKAMTATMAYAVADAMLAARQRAEAEDA